MAEENETDDFALRPYQSQILDIAIKKNTIIYLPTGAGKTYIAVMLINRLSHDIIKPNNKKSVLLVNTVPLVEQHSTTIKRHTDFEVGYFSGDQNVDYWTEEQWLSKIKQYQVFVLTAQIFLDIIRHGYFSLERVNLLIFDECHQAVNDQPMRQIMQLFQNVSDQYKPRVLGLTATLLNGNCAPRKVQEEVANLETTFHGTVATVQKLSQVIGYSTNPQEKIVYFNSPVQNDIILKSVNMLNNLKEFISGLKFNEAKVHQKKMLNHKEKESKSLIKVLNVLMLHIEMFGIYGGSRATLASIIQIERMKRMTDDNFLYKILSVLITTLTTVLKLLEDLMTGYEKTERILKFSTPQVITLINILRGYKDDDNLCGIIFVKQRFTAKLLYYVVRDLSECCPDFNFIRTDFMVGYTAGSSERDTREIFYSAKINKKIVNSFKNCEINLLIASNVVEEGIDVPRCTLVVKFDKPMDYRSYVQSKGRARHETSLYYILVPIEEKEKYQKSYDNFRIVESLLQEYLVGKSDERQAPSKRNITKVLYEDHDLPPYYVDGPDSPHVSAVSAISLLNRYCQMLHHDKYSTLAPNWYLEEKMNDGRLNYIVIIEMPIICPLRDPIKGLPMPTKVSAKRSAALEVCKKLHQINELTDHLLPRTEIEHELDYEYLFEHWIQEQATDEVDAPKPGTKKFIRQYKVSVPKVLLPTESKIYYIHPIVMKPEGFFDKLENLLLTNLDFALLTRNPLPELCMFPIFVSAGKLEINLKVNHKSLILNDNEIMDLKKFYNFVLSELLRVSQHFLMYDNDEENGFMIVVPVRNNIVDMLLDFEIDLDIARQYVCLEPIVEPSKQEKIDLNVTNGSHYCKIVSPWYRDCDPYIVLKVCKDLTALSPWPNDNFSSYKDYFEKKYVLSILNPKQPLLFVKGISKRLNCIHPRSASLHTGNKRNKQSQQEGSEEHLVPELCVVQKFPGTLWYKAHCLPTIIHRVFCLLQAEELRQKIAGDTKIGFINYTDYETWSPLCVDTRIMNTEEKKIQPVQQRSVTDGTLAILPTKEHFTNKDYTSKMLEKQYLWKDEDEPVDIDRNIDSITLCEIQDYEHFISEKCTFSDIEKMVNCPKISKYPALTLQQNYKEKPIQMLSSTSEGGPELSTIFQCLSSNKANEIVNLERMETLGDSFLKLSSTLFLFLQYPQCTEGRLTNIKGKLIGNKNLLYCGLKKNLGGYMKVSDFSPSTEWLPPSYCVPKMLRDKIESKTLSPNKLFEFGIPLEECLLGELYEDTIEIFQEIIAEVYEDDYFSSMTKFLGFQSVQDKTVSDCVESLIGAYLQSNGLNGGLAIIEWFNIIPFHLNPKTLFSQLPQSPLINPNITTEEIDFLIPNYKKLEENLGYTFKNRAFLLQALTHASYSTNRFTDCYQRLEFLGDAVLDFLITSHIYEISDKLTPGELTDLRSALVNNVTFAVLVVRNDFQKHLKYTNTKLMEVIDTFVKFQEERGFVINEEALILVEEHPMYIAEYIHVPKVLGDLFESLAGAIFLDSGMDLQVTWKVFHRLMWQEIETFRWNVPKSPVRMLYENVSAAAHFQKPKVIENKITVVSCSVMVDGKKHDVHGFGENKHQAKRAAAKLALRLFSIE